MIRVVHVVWNLAGGGAERLILDLCRHGPVDLQQVVQPLVGGGEMADHFRVSGVEVLPPASRRAHMGPRSLARLTARVRDFDIVHTHLWAGDLWGRLAGAAARRPVVTTEHNTREDAAWRGAVTRSMVPLSRRFIAVSDAAAVGLPQGRVEVIANGIDLQRHGVRPWPEAPKKRVLFMGRLEPQKGVDVLLSALRQVPECEVELLGEGRERPRLEAQARALGGRANFHGWLPDPGPMLDVCRVVVMPSRWEGFGLVAVEAMAAGRAVIASDVDALPDVLGDVGVLVPADDPQALAAALVEIFSDPQALRTRAARGPGRAAAFDIRRTAEVTAALYREVVRGQNGV
jgi:glycosyltransferase involved in cell wall biosynthesis